MSDVTGANLYIPPQMIQDRAVRLDQVQESLHTGLPALQGVSPQQAALLQQYFGTTVGSIHEVRHCCPFPTLPQMPMDPMMLMWMMQMNQQMMMTMLMWMMMQQQGPPVCRCLPWLWDRQPQPVEPHPEPHPHPEPQPLPQPEPQPPVVDQDLVTRTATGLHQAMAGAGTDEAALIRLLHGRSNAEMAAIREAYQQMYGESLEDAVRGDTSGHFEDLLVAQVRGQRDEQGRSDPTRDATALHTAMAGLGTDEDKLIEVLANRTPAQVREIARAYEQMYGESLADALRGDTSGHFEDGLVGIVEQSQQEQPAPRPAPAPRPGPAPAPQPAPGPSPEEQRRQAARAAGTRNATALHTAMAGGGTDEAALIRTLTNASNAEIQETRRAYEEMYGESLEDAVRGDTSGNFEDTLLALLEGNRDESGRVDPNQVTRDATALHNAMAGLGTTDEVLIRVLTSRSSEQIRAISAAYQQMYGESLEDAVRGDTSGWYEEALVAQLTRPSTVGR